MNNTRYCFYLDFLKHESDEDAQNAVRLPIFTSLLCYENVWYSIEYLADFVLFLFCFCFLLWKILFDNLAISCITFVNKLIFVVSLDRIHKSQG
jgi:hypothetical protein